MSIEQALETNELSPDQQIVIDWLRSHQATQKDIDDVYREFLWPTSAAVMMSGVTTKGEHWTIHFSDLEGHYTIESSKAA